MDFSYSQRQAWAPLIGQRRMFRGTIERFGHKHRQGEQIKKGATLVLSDVHQLHSSRRIDHVWINYTPNLASFGEHLRPHGQLQFSAVVGSYVKGGKNSALYDVKTFNDLELTELTKIEVIKEPYWTKKYHAIIDDELRSYVIRTRQNLKSGFNLGDDPQHRLGPIYIGQGFCNRFAKTLSWRWNNELPSKYR